MAGLGCRGFRTQDPALKARLRSLEMLAWFVLAPCWPEKEVAAEAAPPRCRMTWLSAPPSGGSGKAHPVFGCSQQFAFRARSALLICTCNVSCTRSPCCSPLSSPLPSRVREEITCTVPVRPPPRRPALQTPPHPPVGLTLVTNQRAALPLHPRRPPRDECPSWTRMFFSKRE